MTSLLTIAVVSYISYCYLWFYLPVLIDNDKMNIEFYGIPDVNIEIPAKVYFMGGFFVIFPTYIFWVLGMIVFGDSGVVDKALISKIYRANKISIYEIGTKYTM